MLHADTKPWTAWWVTVPPEQCLDIKTNDIVAEYRLDLEVDANQTLPLKVTADQRFILFHNDRLLVRGPHRNDERDWHYHKLEIELSTGVHRLTALVWSLRPEHAPLAQHSLRHGFLLQAAGLDTGHADWRVRLRHERSFAVPPIQGGRYAGGIETYDAVKLPGPFLLATRSRPAVTSWGGSHRPEAFTWGERTDHRLRPTPLPPMIERPWPGHRVRRGDDGWHALFEQQASLGVRPTAKVWFCWIWMIMSADMIICVSTAAAGR